FSNSSRTSARPWCAAAAEICQRVPIARATFRGGVCGILGEEVHDRIVVSEQPGGVDIAACDLGMRGENFPRLVERAVPDGNVDDSPRGSWGVVGLPA